jgi:hypothetical protein
MHTEKELFTNLYGNSYLKNVKGKENENSSLGKANILDLNERFSLKAQDYHYHAVHYPDLQTA